MLSQTFCYWEKQQSADSNIIQLHLTLKCTKDQSLWLFLSFEMSFSTLRPLSGKFHAGSEQPQVCVVINNSSYPTVKTTTQLIMHLGNIECRLEGFGLKDCWAKVIYCICPGLSDGQYFTGFAGILLLILQRTVKGRYFENQCLKPVLWK